MAKIVVKSAKFGIVAKELDTASYQDEKVLIQALLQAIPDAEGEGKTMNDRNDKKEYLISEKDEQESEFISRLLKFL